MTRVVKAYRAQYPNPIAVHQGDRVRVGKPDSENPAWRWCTGPDGREGWTPESFMRVNGEAGDMLRDYSARELTVEAGSEVSVHETQADWAWVTGPDGRSGWVPIGCLAGD
jgi:SH3-like domain-containing protein